MTPLETGHARAQAVDPDEAARACLYSVVDRFNTEDPFWGAFTPEPGSTTFGDGRFRLVLTGAGERIVVEGTMVMDAGDPTSITPQLVVGDATPGTARSQWVPVACAIDGDGRLVTADFRRAIETVLRRHQ